jgi:glycosyltransferase involved in cell wall biosynthesis
MACMTSQQTNDEFTYEVLIIDDASSDDTRETAQQIIDTAPIQVRYLREKGCGYTAVLNRAVKEFHGQWLAFFDDDQLTHSTWLKELYTVGIKQNAEMIGGPIVLDLPDEVIAKLGPVCRDLYGESPDVREPQKYAAQPPLPSGGNRLVNRRVFENIGTFDEAMLTGGCDRDFLLRAKAVNITMAWAPQAIGRHRIPPERISYKHIKWYSLQWGCSFAYIDWKRFGTGKTTLFCITRIGQALVVNSPKLLWAKIRNNSIKTIDIQALLWRAVGYTKKTLQIIAPRLFSQKQFFSRVEFRRSRENT